MRFLIIIVALGFVNAAQAAESSIRHVVMVSVDGLRSDAIIQLGPKVLPSIHRLLADAGTLDARCDATLSLTLPNHTTMVTGRPVSGPYGHKWTTNQTPPETATYHNHVGRYVPSAFDVAHDHGIYTALLAGKEKFVLMDRSWNKAFGAVDKTGSDQGTDKIDQFVMDANPSVLTDAMVAIWRADTPKSLVLLHYRQPDGAGHGYGWDLTPGSKYLSSIQHVDQELGKLFAYLDGRPSLRNSVAILLTADHGGGVPFRSHIDPNAPVVYTIPYLAWVGGHAQGIDLYEVNRGVRAPQPGNSERVSPPNIRNGELGNTALHLLGLPAIPASVWNARQDLVVLPQ